MARVSNRRPGIKEMSPGQFLVQVQIAGKRATARISGALADAVKEHARLVQELTGAPRSSKTGQPASRGPSSSPTLRDWLRGRYAARSVVVQAATTRKVFESQVGYLIFYLGDRLVGSIGPADVNWYVEKRHVDGPMTFTLTKAGHPKLARTKTVNNASINKSLSVLRAALHLAHREGVIDAAPRVELLPEDDSQIITPPDDATLNTILAAAELQRNTAPWLPEAIELSIETGLRKGELFNLTWRSVDWAAGPHGEGALHVAEQTRGRLVGGKAWKPKNRKSRTVPLSPKARELLETIRGEEIPKADALVFPNEQGCPYLRLQTAEKGSGVDTWRTLKENMGHDVRWHDLRHLFAVRCLSANIDLSTVSRWLGHSVINLTVKRYGRFAADSHEQWAKIGRVGSGGRAGAPGQRRG